MARRSNKERRGTLRSHLRELRIRLSWSAGFLVVGTVVGWFLFDPVFSFLQEPLKNVAQERGIDASANFTTVVSAFDLRIQLSIFLGVILTSPVWLWNIWAFVSPGLKAKERKYAIGFMVSALPLFLAGTTLAWASLPGFVVALIGFTPEGSTNVINAADYAFMMLTHPIHDVDSLQRFVASGLVDGFILMQVQLEDPRVRLLQRTRTPFVLVGRCADNDGVSFVDLDIIRKKQSPLRYFRKLVWVCVESCNF
jgi:Tat protein translocase TatC